MTPDAVATSGSRRPSQLVEIQRLFPFPRRLPSAVIGLDSTDTDKSAASKMSRPEFFSVTFSDSALFPV